MPDLPDWWQGFYLVGSDITINVNIEASDVTLPISIDAATVTLDVNLATQAANIEITFADQSIAVFDAAKWFSHQAEQIFVWAQDNFAANSSGTLASRTVPTGKTFYIAGFAWGHVFFEAITGTHGRLRIAGVNVCHTAGVRGGHVILDVPLRAAAGEDVILNISNVCAAAADYSGGFWGWDEED
jgi:hypothetical protein